MRTIRVSVTAIDSWQWWKDHPDMELDELLAQLRGESPQTEAMRKGSAFHSALETATEGHTAYLQADGYRFYIEPEMEIALPQIRELKLERVFPVTDSLSIELVGKVDAIHGNTVEDHKTTGKTGSKLAEWMESQMDGYQWRHYLNIAGGDTFQWNCFVVDDVFAMPIDAPGLVVYNVREFHQIRQHRYPGLEADCERKLKEFVDSLGLDRMEHFDRIGFPSTYCTLANLLKQNKGRDYEFIQ